MQTKKESSELPLPKPALHAQLPLPSSPQFADALSQFDASLPLQAATAEGQVIVPVGKVDVESGTATVKLELLPTGSLLTRCVGNDNIIAIHSARYSPQPLLLQGPGAGAQLMASGLFADLLTLSRSLVEWAIPQIL